MFHPGTGDRLVQNYRNRHKTPFKIVTEIITFVPRVLKLFQSVFVPAEKYLHL